MSEVKKIATRESYGNALVELGKEHEDLVVLDADLAGATKTGMFKKAFPERHIDCGIAECNMIGVSRYCYRKKFHLQVHLLCLQQDVHLSRFVTQLDIQN